MGLESRYRSRHEAYHRGDAALEVTEQLNGKKNESMSIPSKVISDWMSVEELDVRSRPLHPLPS